MPPPVTPKNHHAVANKMKDAARTVAEASMAASADEAKQNDGTADISVSMDGTWQKRGFSSLNGVVVAVSTSNFKVLDVDHVGKLYSLFIQRGFSKNNKGRVRQMEGHSCNKLQRHANYEGSMEVAVAVRIFQRTIEKHGARYVNYYGYGDSKSFHEVKSVYPEITVEKCECIGHY